MVPGHHESKLTLAGTRHADPSMIMCQCGGVGREKGSLGLLFLLIVISEISGGHGGGLLGLPPKGPKCTQVRATATLAGRHGMREEDVMSAAMPPASQRYHRLDHLAGCLEPHAAESSCKQVPGANMLKACIPERITGTTVLCLLLYG